MWNRQVFKFRRSGRILTATILFGLGLSAGAEPAPSPTNPAEPDPTVLPPEESRKRIEVPNGYRVELVAAEPMVHEPAMITWDGNGRMWVAELNTYMQDIDGEGQHRPICKVKILEDQDGDGRMDRMTVFADGLVLPRMVLPLDDRVLIRETDTDAVYAYFDENGDGRADRREFAFEAPGGSGGNLEHQDSAMIWSIDNRVYTAMGNQRHRLVDGEWVSEPVHREFAQWGLTQDEVGRLFFSSAGREQPAYGFQQHPKYGRLRLSGELAPGFETVDPIVQTPDVQGGPARISEHGTLNHFTGHCGQSIFIGHRMPRDLVGDYLLPEPVGRLVRRAKVRNVDGKRVLENAYEGKEFIASTDMNFRPVWSATGPDGTLYLVDMYRGIIQEGNWVRPGSYLRGPVEELGLDRNIGRGRIYRVVHESIERDPERPRMLEESPDELLAHLSHPNAWWRMEAQKLIVLSGDRSIIPDLKTLAREADRPITRVHAVWTLDGLGARDEDLIFASLSDPDPRVRLTAVRLTDPWLQSDHPRALEALRAVAEDKDPTVLAQLLNTLRYGGDKARDLILKVLEQQPENDLLLATGRDALQSGAATADSRLPDLDAESLQAYIRGRETYTGACVACHGPDGEGQASGDLLLGPALTDSDHLRSAPASIRILLHGSTAGMSTGRYPNMMAPYKGQEDRWIADILTYARIRFAGRSAIAPEQVAEVRRETAARDKPYGEGELNAYLPVPRDAMKQWSFDATHNPDALPRAVDGDPDSRWDTGTEQKPGMWIGIDFGRPYHLTGLLLDTRGSENDYPRQYRVEIRSPGEEWSEPIVTGNGRKPITDIDLPPDTVAQELRIRQTGNADGLYWSIHELRLHGAPIPR